MFGIATVLMLEGETENNLAYWVYSDALKVVLWSSEWYSALG